MHALQRMWDLAPRYRNMKLICGWILSCTNLEFVDDAIIGASFDHNKLRERVLSEQVRFVNAQAVKVQAVVRGFSARSQMRPREPGEAKDGQPPSIAQYSYKGKAEIPLLYGSALEENSMTSYSSFDAAHLGVGTGMKSRPKFNPGASYLQVINGMHSTYARQQDGDSDYDAKKPLHRKDWDDSTVVRRSGYRSDGGSLSDDSARRRHRKRRVPKKNATSPHRSGHYDYQNESRIVYYSDDDDQRSISHQESASMLAELLDVRSEISEALDMFRAEMSVLRTGLAQQTQMQGSTSTANVTSPEKNELDPATAMSTSPRDEMDVLREEMKKMLSEMKELHEHMNQLRNEDIVTKHKEEKEVAKSQVTLPDLASPQINTPVRIGSYSTVITDVRPLTGTEALLSQTEVDARPKSRVSRADFQNLEQLGPNTEYQRPKLLLRVNSVDFEADSRSNAEILKDIENAARDPSIDAKLRQEESEELARIGAEELHNGRSATRLQFQKEAERFRSATNEHHTKNIMEELDETYSPTVLREAIMGALIRNDVKLAEKAAVRLLLLISRMIESGSQSFHFMLDTVLPRFDSAVASMQQFSLNRTIVKAYVEILALVLASTDTEFVVEEYGTAGLCNVLLDAADNIRDDEDLATQVILQCARLTSSSVKNRHRMGTIQNGKIISDLFSRHGNSKSIVTKLTRLVCNICTQAPLNIDNLGEVGMCERLLDCMVTFRDDPKVINLVSRAILQLCYNNHMPNQRRFASSRGFDVFFHCLQCGIGGSISAVKQVGLVIMGVCGTDPSVLEQLPVGSLVRLTKNVFALGTDIPDVVAKTVLSIIFNFCSSTTIRTALYEAGTLDLLSHMLEERSDPDIQRMVSLCSRRIAGLNSSGTTPTTTTPFDYAVTRSIYSSGKSRVPQSVEASGGTRAVLPMGDHYQRPHILKAQRSAELDTNQGRSAEILRNIERAAADPSIEKRLREKEAKEISEQRAIDASERLRRSAKEAEERQRGDISGGRLDQLDALVSRTNDPALLRKVLISAVTVHTSELLTEKTLQTILLEMNARHGKEDMAAFIEAFSSFDGIVPALRMFPDNLAVVKCCIEMVTLMLVSVESAVYLVEDAGRAGMLDLIVDSIVRGVDDHDLAMQAILLACRLTVDSQRNRYRMGSIRNCEILGNLFMSFINAKPVLTKLARLCGNLAVNAPSVLDVLGESGVCDKVLQCMHHNRYDRYTLNLLVKVVLLLCDYNHKNIRLFTSSKGFEVCVMCLATSRSSDPDTFRQICMMMIALFGTSPVGLDLLPSAQIAEAFKSIIEDDQLDELSLKVALSVLYNFSASTSLRSSLNQIGVREILSRLSTTHSDQDIVSSALMLHNRLSDISPSSRSGSLQVSSQPYSLKPTVVESKLHAEVGGNTRPRDETGGHSVAVENTKENSRTDPPSPTFNSKTNSESLSTRSERLPESNRGDSAGTKGMKSGELLRSIERAVADPTLDHQLRATESRRIEEQRERDTTEKLRRSTQLIIDKQRRESSAGSPMRAEAFDLMIGRSNDPKTLRESLLTALLLSNEDIVEKSLRKIFTMLKDIASNRVVLENAAIIFSTFDSLVNSLRQFPKNKEIVICSIGCVSVVLEASNNSIDWVEEAGRCGLCDYLIDTCWIDEDMCVRSLRLCTTLTNSSIENRHRIGTRHNCDVIRDIYSQYKLNSTIILRLTHFIHNICAESPTVLDNLGSSGLCEQILECLDHYYANADMVSALSKTILLFCYNNHSANRQRFASPRGAEVCMKCLLGAMVPGAGDTYKQICLMMIGVFGTAPDSLHLFSPIMIADIAKTVVLGNKGLDDTHLKATLTLIFNFGSNDDIKAALLSAGIQDALIDMQTSSRKSGVPRLALLAFRRIASLETRGSGQSASSQRRSIASAQGKHRVTTPKSATTMLPEVGVEAGQRTFKTERTSPPAESTRMSTSAAVPVTSLPKMQERVPTNEIQSQQPTSPYPTATDGVTETTPKRSPHKPLVPNSSGNAPPNRAPRKVVERSFTMIESDPLFHGLPAMQSEVPPEDVAQVREAEERLQTQVSHDEAVRRIQRVFRKHVDRRRHENQSKSVQFRLAALLEIVDKSDDEAILVSCIDMAIECRHNDLAVKTLKRCNVVVKRAKENKENSMLAVKLIDRSKVLMDLLTTFMDDSGIIMIGTELITRVSYAGGASDAFGKAGVFDMFYTALNTYPDSAILVGALLVCGVRLTSKKTSNKKRAGTMEGFRTIVKIYKHHLNNPLIVDRLTRYTCNCIDNLPACQDYFRVAGGCEVVVDVYTLGPEHLESIEIVSRLLINLTAMNNVENMKALGTRQALSKYFDGLAISSMNPKVFKSVAMMICNVFCQPDLFVDILRNCELPQMLIGILNSGSLSVDLDRQEVVFASLMVVQFFSSMEALQPMLLSSRLPNVVIQYTDKSYGKRIRKAATLINKRLRGETANSELSDSSSVKTR